jgi:hypothetical protein
LIELGLGVDDHRVQLLTAELIVDVNFPISPDVYRTMIELFGSVLSCSDADLCFKIANVFKRMIKLSPEIELIKSFVDILQSPAIDDDLKIAVFIPVDELARQRSSELIDSFELLLTLAIQVSAALFDDSCSQENPASSVTFSFVKTFAKISNPAAFLLRSMNSGSPALLFASLSALSVAVKYFSDDLDELFSFLVDSIKTDAHSIQERSLSLIDKLVVEVASESALLTDIMINHVIPLVSAEHFAVRQLALRCVIRFLFRVEVAGDCSKFYFSVLIELFSTFEDTTRSLVVIALSAAIYRFRDLSTEFMAPMIGDISDLARSADAADPASQARAIETLAYCIRFLPELCREILPSAIELFVAALESENRGIFQSGCYSLKSLSKGGRPEIVEILPRILAEVCKVFTIPESDKDSVDDSGLAYSDLQRLGLKLVVQLVKQFEDHPEFRSFISLLCEFSTRANFWECEDEVRHACQVFCFCCPSSLDQLLPSCKNDPEFWPFLETVVRDSRPIPDHIKEYVCEFCLFAVKSGDRLALRPIAILKRRYPGVMSIHAILELFSELQAELSVADLCEFVDAFTVFFELTAFANCDPVIMELSLGLISHCEQCLVNPSPIRFFNALVRSKFVFDDASLQNFLQFFAWVLANAAPDAQYFEETVLEMLRVALPVVLGDRHVDFDFGQFLRVLPSVLPPKKQRPVGDIYSWLISLTTGPLFPRLSDGHELVFAAIVQTLGCDQRLLKNRGIETKSIRSMSDFIRRSVSSHPSLEQEIPSILGSNAVALSCFTANLT